MEYEEWKQEVISILGQSEFDTDEESFWKAVYETDASPEDGVTMSMTYFND